MTNAAPSSTRSSGAERLGQTLRRSIVGVRGASNRGTGWTALSNGLVVVRQQVVGYAPEATLELEGGRTVPARVLWADVAHDLAFVMPRERQTLPPLLARPDLPRLGEEAFLLSSAPGAAFRVLAASICALDVRAGGSRSFELDLAPALVGSGGPVVDVAGRVIGIAGLDLAGTSRFGADVPSSLALPVAALSRAFSAFDHAAPQLDGRSPVYHCPGCGSPFGGEEPRCFTCGRLLPHARVAREDDPGDAAAPPAGAERFVRELLATLGFPAPHVRVGPRRWRFPLSASKSSPRDPTEVTLELDEQGTTLRGRAPVVRLPGRNQEAFYRFLLSINDQAAGTVRLSLAADLVMLSFVEPLSHVRDTEAVVLVRELVRLAELYRKVLADPFEATPVTGETLA